MQNIYYVLISILGGLVVPLQLAVINAFRHSSGASQIQSTFFLYIGGAIACLLYTSPSPRDRTRSRMPSSA